MHLVIECLFDSKGYIPDHAFKLVGAFQHTCCTTRFHSAPFNVGFFVNALANSKIV